MEDKRVITAEQILAEIDIGMILLRQVVLFYSGVYNVKLAVLE
jgi:hypothetical protein